MNKLLYILIFVPILLVSCASQPTDSKNGQNVRTVIVELNGVDTYRLVNDTEALPSKDTCIFISNSLKTALDNYKNKEVWFKLIAYYPYFIEYDSKNIDFKEDIIKEEMEFSKKIGVTNIRESKKSSEFYWSGAYYMEATSEMIELILERKTVQLTLAPPDRIDGYNNKISDTLTYCIENMSDSDLIEIAAVCVYDNYNSYSQKQDVGKNSMYNNNLFIPFSKGLNFSFEETDALIEKSILNILMRNNILEKRVESDNLPTIGFGEIIYTHTAMLEDIPVGFNAMLTKAEILKLSEDGEIKVIYAAKQSN